MKIRRKNFKFLHEFRPTYSQVYGLINACNNSLYEPQPNRRLMQSDRQEEFVSFLSSVNLDQI